MIDLLFSEHLPHLAYAFGAPACNGVIKSVAADFEVSEKLSFPLSNTGSHAYLLICKQNINTEDVAKQLASIAGTKQVAIGYAGLKDKLAISYQWFSVDLSGRPEPNWSVLENNQIQIKSITRHTRKLRRGAIIGNEFCVVIRSIEGNRDDIESRLGQIGQYGVPNYFGSQRFGHNEMNLRNAVAMFNGELRLKSRHLRSIYLSAARAFLFNLALSTRVQNNNWNIPLPGDAMQLHGSNSFFVIEAVDQTIQQRTAAFDIHPSGPLFGLGHAPTSGIVAAIENGIKEDYLSLVTGLEKMVLKQDRRSLRAILTDFHWQYVDENSLKLKFLLPTGSYATSVLRELISTSV